MYGLGITASEVSACGSSQALYYVDPFCWSDSFAAWQTALAQQNAVMTIPAPAVPGPPTQAQLDTCAAAADPGTCAAALAQSLSDASVTGTQAILMDWATGIPSTTGTLGTTPFCGTGSTQWISGLDNCTLLEIAAAIAGVLLVINLSGAKRNRF